jgi:hypothetical protein
MIKQDILIDHISEYVEIKSGVKSPYANLLIAIMVSGIADHDTDYFESRQFVGHCKLLKITPEIILTVATKAWAA